MSHDIGIDNGRVLNSSVIEQGLRALNKDIHFDVGTNTGQWHPYQSTRQGVFYHGQHLVSMDRGEVPEWKMWTVTEQSVPCDWAEADMEGVSLAFETVDPSSPGYRDLRALAATGKYPELQLRVDGRLLQLVPKKVVKGKGRCIRVGWRHTFERLVMCGIPGVTRESIGAMFGVNMLAFPMGSPDQVSEALVAE